MKKDIETHSAEGGQPSGRRKLLKALTAGGAAAAVMPSQWTTPALKSVVLPAHAQTTPGADGTCGIFGWFWVSTGTTSCFSMSANVKADSSCNGPTTVRVFNSGGDQIASCNASLLGSPQACFSCSQEGTVPPANEGDSVTFVAETDGGCSCTFVTTAR